MHVYALPTLSAAAPLQPARAPRQGSHFSRPRVLHQREELIFPNLQRDVLGRRCKQKESVLIGEEVQTTHEVHQFLAIYTLSTTFDTWDVKSGPCRPFRVAVRKQRYLFPCSAGSR